MPLVDEFEYTFDNLADIIDSFTEELGLDAYSLYVMDYGASVGFRLAVFHPERVQALIVQNGNAYEEGLRMDWQILSRQSIVACHNYLKQKEKSRSTS